MRSPSLPVAFTLNGRSVEVRVPPSRRLADLLRDDLGLTGTKIGCNAGDCGACTVLLNGRQACACLVPAAQVEGMDVRTVEGLAESGALGPLQRAFLRHGAAQCGICTPGMLMAAADLLARNAAPSEPEVRDALGGVLCRCTGYRKIIEAVLDVAGADPPASPEPAVGARLPKVDGAGKLTGAERFGADALPDEAFLTLRVVRSPYPHARFTLGETAPLLAAHPGLVSILTAADIPGRNLYGIYPTGKDQPVLAEAYVRHRGEPVCALVGDAETVAAIPDSALRIAWEALDPVAFGAREPALHAHAPENVLCRGRVARGDVAAGLRAAAHAQVEVETAFVEHAYIEPEAGYARRVGDRIEVVACTQTPYMDRDELAGILGIAPEQVRVVPTAVGGGFGGKLDLSIQPLACVAAWRLGRPVRLVYTRPESMAATTKRHPARIRAEAAADGEGRLTALRFEGVFNTGAYASWGPTVANRVPVHASGPYLVPAVQAETAALHTTDPPAGAFRGFGVPQAAIATEALMDMLAERIGQDPLEFRHRNALRPGDRTATGQELGRGAALVQCLDALRPRWQALRAEAASHNRAATRIRRGVGVACMWYGIGNTSMSNPSEMAIGIEPSGRAVLLSGAVDIGQGSNTIMLQIAADALGVSVGALHLVAGDTDRTPDAGKTSASRQTFVSGNAARLAGAALRAEILRRVNAGADAEIRLDAGRVCVSHDGTVHTVELGGLTPDRDGFVLRGDGRFDPPTTVLDADGQGVPYASYAFAAQIAEVEVDTGLGTVRVRRIVAAHDVGRAVNPALVEGQIHGGIAQGLGLALMEEFVPGRTENLHDYLIPTIGDVPEIETILIEEADPLGPYGAKGVGEPALVATAPAILNAIKHATGVRITRVPATPDRVLAALRGGV
ncbi:MAG TPA: molybdopterin cofactor-binding domain-containing protein [Acetobacteraceae bacterium]|nr:molybdopterin cofactor-binding domain-containing protein [Acetobacteraceae bacterium]